MRHDIHTRDIKLKMIAARVAKVLYQVLRAGKRDSGARPVCNVEGRQGDSVIGCRDLANDYLLNDFRGVYPDFSSRGRLYQQFPEIVCGRGYACQEDIENPCNSDKWRRALPHTNNVICG